MSFRSLEFILHDFYAIDREMEETGKEKMEEARKKYWDACNLPRKKKKQARKEAVLDFNLYKAMSEYNMFT